MANDRSATLPQFNYAAGLVAESDGPMGYVRVTKPDGEDLFRGRVPTREDCAVIAYRITEGDECSVKRFMAVCQAIEDAAGFRGASP